MWLEPMVDKSETLDLIIIIIIAAAAAADTPVAA